MNIIYKLRRLFFDLIFWVKGKWSILTLGFNYQDTFSLDYSCALWLVPRLKHLKKTKHGIPSLCFDDPAAPHNDETFKSAEDKWNSILDEVIFAFEFELNKDKYLENAYPADYRWGFDLDENHKCIFKDNRKPDYTEYNKLEERAEKGRFLFSKYYNSLWD